MKAGRPEPLATFAVEGRLFWVLPAEPTEEFRSPLSIVGEFRTQGRALQIVDVSEGYVGLPPPARRRPVDFLTPRELQVAALVAKGLVNKEIAARLRISEWTVSTHLRRVFAKLGVENRAAMTYRCSGLFGTLLDRIGRET